MPAYIVKRDGVQIGITFDDVLTFNDTTVVPGSTYLYEVAAYDLGTDTVVSAFSPLTVHIPVTGSRELPIVGFDDERVFGGYFGGKLHGKVVACPGRRVSIDEEC